ncbi:hypothetical protein L9F63_015789 [Diploptera punctata]|uniref:Ionotropic glutamate receptor C-terminal domain-containing protein n=1 Tax=Diploptera punctata TaxID=6984 RepID=A0AAD8A4X1_DIPPU|nr:hypothetical protein L9F63_015789 [Diploptera punctata]
MAHILEAIKLINAIIIINEEDQYKSNVISPLVSEIYTFFPFHKSHQCGKIDELILVDRWIYSDESGKFQFDSNLFPSKIPKKFNGCEIYFTERFNPMIIFEFDFLRPVFESLKLKLRMSDQDGKPIDIPYAGPEGYAALRLFQHSRPETSVTFPHMYTKNNLYVRCPKQNIRHGNFYKVFTLPVWLLIFLTTFLTATVSVFLQKSSKFESKYFRNLAYSLYSILSMLTAVPAPQMPRTVKLRMFLFLWICHCLILSTVFQCFFTSFLVEPGFERPMTSIREIMDKAEVLFVHPSTLNSYFQYSAVMYLPYSLQSKVKATPYPVEDFIETENSVVYASEFEMESTYFKCCPLMESSNAVHVITVTSVSYYYDVLSFKILQCFEAGIFINELNAYRSSNVLRYDNPTQPKTRVNSFPSTAFSIFHLKHFKVVFYILIFGNIISFVVLLGECILFRIKNLLSAVKVI